MMSAEVDLGRALVVPRANQYSDGTWGIRYSGRILRECSCNSVWVPNARGGEEFVVFDTRFVDSRTVKAKKW